MVDNIEHLKHRFKLKLAAKRGVRMSAKTILRKLEKVKKTYKNSRMDLYKLEGDLEILEGRIKVCKETVRASRSKMLKMNEILQNMDLSDAKYAVFYDEDLDVGYIVGNEEKFIDTDDDGEINLIPMIERRKKLRAEKEKENKDEDEDENEEYEYEEYEEEVEEDKEEEDKEEEDKKEEDNNNTDDSFNFIFDRNSKFL